MKLSDADKEILACSYFQADASVASIARQCGRSERSVQYCIAKLIDAGVVRRTVFINASLLGFQEYLIRFSLGAKRREDKKKFCDAIQRSQLVSWFGELGSSYQYGVSIFVRSVSDLQAFFERLSETIGKMPLKKQVSMIVSIKYMVPGFLSDRSYKIRSCSHQIANQTVDIDETDHRILGALMSPAYRSLNDASRRLQLPNSTVECRVKNLRTSGVLVGIGYWLTQSHLLGMSPFVLLLSLNESSAATKRKVHVWAEEQRDVYYISELLGEADFEMGIRVFHPRDMSEIVDDLRDRLGNAIDSIEYFPEIRSFKVSFYPFESFERSNKRLGTP